MSKGIVLVADDDAAIRTVLDQALSRSGFEVRATSNLATLWRWVSSGDGDVVISDVVMPDGQVFDILPKMKKARPEMPIVVMSAQNTFMTAVTASEQGAYEYLPKPFDLQELIATTTRAAAEPKQKKSVKQDYGDADSMPLVGRSSAMQEIYRVLARLMQNDLTLMISGESGTGKELVAKALHEFGKRKNGPFVAINMAAIPKDLIESDLFGHEKGAFTGAINRSSGRFEMAEGGTLFLDEIGDMPMDAQTRLLRVLQQGEYTRVGGRNPIKTDVRIVAATNKDLRSLIANGLFREDLYYRLNVVPMRLPPLRERSEDIPDLVVHFISQNSPEDSTEKSIDSDGLNVMRKYLWPGNVRELENLVRRVIALYPQDVLSGDIIHNELQNNNEELSSSTPLSGEVIADISLATEKWLSNYFKKFGDGYPPPGLYNRALKQFEKPLIASALAYTKGNQIKAAELLGLNRNTLRKKIRDLEVQVVKTPY